jgi:hypothetical protein
VKTERRDQPYADRAALSYGDRSRWLGQFTIFGADPFLDLCDNALTVVFPTVDEQPTRALRHMPAHEQHSESEDCAQTERQPPANRRIDERRVQQRDGQQCPANGAYPERTVDHYVHPGSARVSAHRSRS